MGAAPDSGIPGAPRGPTCLSTSTEFSSIATLSSTMRGGEIRAWSSEDHGPAPVRKVVRQTIGIRISSNFGNSITDFWKTVRRAERLLPRGKELCCSAAGLLGPFLSAVLVAGS